MPTLLLAAPAAFGLAVLSAVSGFGGGVLLLPVFGALFGLRVAVPMLTLTQLSSNGSRVWLNRSALRLRLIGWFALGAVPCAAAGGLLLAHAPLAPLKRLLGVFLIGVVLWRRWQRRPRRPPVPAFAAIGAVSGVGSALLGSVGPLTAPFFWPRVWLGPHTSVRRPRARWSCTSPSSARTGPGNCSPGRCCSTALC